ncbi:MAG: M48 family metalloprotease [Oculatellaceae cyanobacterium Prado106]|jgi:Zn-dependent protease with chaperone function|nr:M48 family metalloprotease [Oculatellaceae cyanobacterium Prado106]
MSNLFDQMGTDLDGGESAFEAEATQALAEGMAAMKRKDYGAAIAPLEAVCLSSSHATSVTQAQMALVKAYVRTGKVESAIARCQSLLEHPHPQVKTWATQTYAELQQRLNRQTDSKPSDSSQDKVSSDASDVEIPGDFTAQDLTGFVPLNETDALPSASRPVIRGRGGDAIAPSPTQPSPQQQDKAKPGTTPGEASVSNPRSSATSTPEKTGSATDFNTDFNTDFTEANPSPSDLVKKPIPTWKQAGRAQKWTGLGKVDMTQMWGVEAVTIIVFLGLICALPWVLQILLNWVLWQISWPINLRRYAAFNHDFRVLLIPILLGLGAVSPWLMQVSLKKAYALQSFSLTDLERYSPEAVRLLKRVYSQRRLPLPRLELLPDNAPLLFAYGHFPRFTRFVVSRGLLEQLVDDEIAALYAAELAHTSYWDFALLSWITLVAQLPYRVYWNVAAWGDRQHDRVLQTLAVAVSTIGYGLYRLCRTGGLWLSRMRHYYSDRAATELTGNPNGLTRALVKVSMGINREIQRQKQTSALLESFELLLPLGYHSALSYSQIPDPQDLEWDRSAPYRRWLMLNNSHPPLGDRLHLLSLYAQHWRLTPELTWSKPQPVQSRQLKRQFRLQMSPYWGMAIGFGLVGLLWTTGWIAEQARWFALSWMMGDRSLLLGCPLMGLSFGLLLRINTLFPDIKHSNLQHDPALPDLMREPTQLPIDSQPVRIQGDLLGRKGFNNWLHQDLILRTESGSIPLHHTSNLGTLGNLMPQPLRPRKLMNEPVTVTGWFRRGATPWIDVETIQAKRGTTLRSEHQAWSAGVAVAIMILGTYILLTGTNR